MPRSLTVAPQHRKLIQSALLRNGFARQQDLAEDLSISRDTVSRYFNSKPVGYLNFYEISLRLGLSIENIAADFVRKDGEIINRLSASFCNLPHRINPLIGREKEIQLLLEYISPEYRQHMTIVQGIGGMGKTALVVEAAHRCWEAKQNSNNSDSNIPIFDAIIFTSAKDTDLLPFGVIQRPIKEVTLQDIFKTIARVLNDKAIIQASNHEQIKTVYDSLGGQRTLLIVDNMETVKGKDREDILGFLNNLPNTVQAIITTREKIWLFSPISLQSLSKKHSSELVQQQANKKNIQITESEALQLYQRFGGVPLALIYLVGRLTGKYSLEQLLVRSVSLPQDIASFCFEESVQPLRDQPAHSLLMSSAIFRTKSEWKALATVAGLQTEPLVMERGLDLLKQLSLLYEEEDKYKILPITREYALVELAKYPDFDREARERWIDYYLELSQNYGGKDWKNWKIKYDILEEDWSNILQVLDWCAVKGLYEKVIKIWNNVDNYVDLKGDWDNRSKWWKWLEIQSSQRSDWSTYINALAAQSWICILKGKKHFDTAENKIRSGFGVTDENPGILEAKANLSIIHSVLLKIEDKYKQSLSKLSEVTDLLQDAGTQEPYRSRYLIRANYHKAEVYNCINNPNQDQNIAKDLFNEVCQQGELIKYSRFVNYAQNELANIAVLEKDYQEAQMLIDRGLREAKACNELIRIGHWLATSWRLEKSQDNLEQAMIAAKTALDYFDNGGGKIKDAKEIEAWLERLEQI